MRLQKYMAVCGIASRRKAEEMISAGRVTVNGEIVSEQGVKVNPEKDVVCVDKKPIHLREEMVYLMVNKPRGYVTTAKDNFDRPTVLDLVPQSKGRLYPVGRLDYDSEGLLFLTNDGDFTFRLTHPSRKISKTYLVLLEGEIEDSHVSLLEEGVMIDGRKTLPAKVSVKKREQGKTVLLITIYEGRNRQVRKMCTAVGHSVLRLRRVAVGPVKLGDLESGCYRHLTEKEIALLGGKTRADN